MISFVYFDVGGVVELDFSGTNKWYELKHDLGIPDDRIKEIDAIWSKHKDKIDDGSIDLKLIEDILREEMHIHIPRTYSMLDDFVNRFEQNPSIWPVIAKIHKTHRIGLLTNMYVGMYQKILKRGLLPNEKWDVIVDSSLIHMKKPDTEIYEYAQQKAGVPANEILFIDNMERNLVSAQALGWQTFLYDSKHPEESSKQLLQLFTQQ